MSTFLTPLKGHWIGKERFMLDEKFVYYRTGFKNVTYTVPISFITDFASIPKIFRWLISKYGRYDKAAVLHDWLYYSGIVSREWADRIFLEAMKILNVKWWKRRAMYRAVRVGGWLAWNKCRSR